MCRFSKRLHIFVETIKKFILIDKSGNLQKCEESDAI